jgi:hypothetical protein
MQRCRQVKSWSEFFQQREISLLKSAACKQFVCGAVQVAAEQGCLWWEIDSKVYAANKDLIGNLQTVTGGSTNREIKDHLADFTRET